MDMLDFALARRAMVDSQLRTFDVNSLPLLAAMDEVPRECFVPEKFRAMAYIDRMIPVGEGDSSAEDREMLAPAVLGRLIQALAIEQGEKALDVATGRGYAAAVLSRLGARVTALDSSEELAAKAREALGQAGCEEVEVVAGPLEQGWSRHAPYDVILVNGAVDRRPEELLRQLADGGRLACIEGRGRSARATLYVRSGDAFGSRQLFDAAAPSLRAFQVDPGFVF